MLCEISPKMTLASALAPQTLVRVSPKPIEGDRFIMPGWMPYVVIIVAAIITGAVITGMKK